MEEGWQMEVNIAIYLVWQSSFFQLQLMVSYIYMCRIDMQDFCMVYFGDLYGFALCVHVCMCTSTC